MKYYRHYKQKPYRFIGLARHSETQEEVVIYETLYESPGGRIWVRPKDMFFESILFEGKLVPRFDPVPLDLQSFTDIQEPQIQMMGSLALQIFAEWDRKWFDSTFQNHSKFMLLLAFIDQVPVGFKLGYETDQTEFYSWMGGVLPEYRGLGVASDLMRAQHQWCQQHNYKTIRTKTQNRFREMLILNLKHGFDLIGTHLSGTGDLKLILQKKL